MNEKEAQAWIMDGLAWIGRGVSITPNFVDDKVVRAVMVALSNEVIWGWIWPVIRPMFEDKEILVGAAEDAPAEVCLAADEVGMSPVAILALVRAIMELIKLFRNQ
jgi:hypothetical protein